MRNAKQQKRRTIPQGWLQSFTRKDPPKKMSPRSQAAATYPAGKRLDGTRAIAHNTWLRRGKCTEYLLKPCGRIHYVLDHIYMAGGTLQRKHLESIVYNDDHITIPLVLGLIKARKGKRNKHRAVFYTITPIGTKALAILEDASSIREWTKERHVHDMLGALPSSWRNGASNYPVKRTGKFVKVPVKINKRLYKWHCSNKGIESGGISVVHR